MPPSLKYVLQLICSTVFSISIFLPVSITVFPADSGNLKDFANRQNNRMVRLGIGPIDAILGSLCDTNPDDINGDGASEGSQVLVSQRRALVRVPVSPKPVLSTALLPVHDLHPFIQAPRAYEHPEISRYQDSELFLTLNTGVSPPAVVLPTAHS